MTLAHRRTLWVCLFATLPLALLTGCEDGLSPQDAQKLASMKLRLEALPSSPTNLYADDADAADLGRHIFFDKGMSADGKVACATCHDMNKGYCDSKAFSLGVDGRVGTRHSMPIVALPFQRFLFWDGRADSLWSQPLKAIESEKEMDFTRLEVAHFVASTYSADYEAIFGPLPELEGLPARAAPGMPEWDTLTAEQQDDVQRVFANVGKVLEAYERKLPCANTRFDRWARGELEMTADENAGADDFMRNGCVNCHSGPAFSDGQFHNIGIGSGTDVPDYGRSGAVSKLLVDTFNGSSSYSDDPVFGQAQLNTIASETGTVGAFRTASLRGAGQREFFGQRGSSQTLDDFVRSTYNRPHLETGAVGELDSKLRGVRGGGGDLVTFLHMLDCPAPPLELQEP